ncbi:MAG: hypothetical protein HYR88_02055 [Verrucomicrobia bacterium]|nr:hypothetical protein [Verrucomicrobiota bacterium]MBI3871381.1 hypothetical protein [Verrucomicrobiota bacterium]
MRLYLSDAAVHKRKSGGFLLAFHSLEFYGRAQSLNLNLLTRYGYHF